MNLYERAKQALERLNAEKPEGVTTHDVIYDDIGYLGIEERLEKNGYVLLWSDVLMDYVAYYKTPEDLEKIPSHYICYSDNELRLMFGDNPVSERTLKTIHMAKKITRFEVTDVTDYKDGEEK